MRLLALIKRELRSIRREKTIVFALFIQLFIAAFSSFLMIGVMSFYSPETIGENAPIYVNVGILSPPDSTVAYYVERDSGVSAERYNSLEAAEAAFKSGRVDAVMVIPPRIGGIVDMTLILPQSDAESMLITMTLDRPLNAAENALRRESGIELKYEDLEGKPHTQFEFLYSIIIPVLMFFPALIAGSITIDTISEELQNKTLDTLWAAPVSLGTIFSSKILTAGFTALVQCLLWIGLLSLNSLSVHRIPLVLLLATLIAFCVSLGAGIIALILRDRERAQFVYSVGLVTMAGLGYLFNPSPFELMSRLAAGGYLVGLADVACYLLPLALLAILFFVTARQLAVVRT